ncbi:hypothetical protein ACFWUQ_26345 [Streptomyces sp. NPDC058662]|uniref:hypothetical protein n=1 Tax=Streptomyces sp. NPDC058662 TaxID=3346583 RepID=UPI003654328F
MGAERAEAAGAQNGPGTAAERVATGILENPVVGMAPWIAFSLLVGPGRFELAVGLALAVSVALVVFGRLVRHGASWKILELSDLVFFTAMTLIGLAAGPGTLRWLETYAGEVSNIALTVIAFGSMAVRTPFTLQYARERVDPSRWHTPAFVRANYAITGAWGLAFLAAAVAGAYGDLVLRNPNNIWTGWIIQILAIVAALRFTAWYPEVVRARARRAAGAPDAGPEPGTASLLLPLAGLLVPIGIAVLVFDAAWWLGTALIVAGVLVTKALRKRDPTGIRTKGTA